MRHLHVQSFIFFTLSRKNTLQSPHQWGAGEMEACTGSVAWGLQCFHRSWDWSDKGLEANQHMFTMPRLWEEAVPPWPCQAPLIMVCDQLLHLPTGRRFWGRLTAQRCILWAVFPARALGVSLAPSGSLWARSQLLPTTHTVPWWYRWEQPVCALKALRTLEQLKWFLPSNLDMSFVWRTWDWIHWTHDTPTCQSYQHCACPFWWGTWQWLTPYIAYWKRWVSVSHTITLWNVGQVTHQPFYHIYMSLVIPTHFMHCEH